MYKQTITKELTFEGERLTRGRHKIHPYPAMLHPLLVDFLLEKYSKKDSVVFDPFCGSGVTLVESAKRGNLSYGFDINPLALLIAKTKTTKYNIKKLEEEFHILKDLVKKSKKIDIPEDIKNIDYWYKQDVKKDLGKIRYVLKNNKFKYQNFFITCFAYICRNQSLTRNGEFKRYRVKFEKIDKLENEVIDKFFEHIERSVSEFKENDIPKIKSEPILNNSENGIDKKIRYDLVITSPPYGDSRTTVAYGEYSSFGSEWTDDLHTFGNTNYRVDKESLGKKNEINEDIFTHKELSKIINKIKKEDKKRSEDVIHFFNGYYKVIENVIKNLKKNGTVCFVVGNRTVKGHQIPMDQITASFLDGMGLNFEGIFVRDIVNKVMPSKNSPTNKTGKTKSTMVNEYIVVFNKK